MHPVEQHYLDLTRRRFFGDTFVFYLMIGSLVAPGLVLGLGTGLLFQWIGINASWYTSALGAQLSWTLPFGVLVMFAVMSRFSSAWEEAARDLGANAWQTIYLVIIPILAGAFGNFLIPLQIGADDMAFPTLNMLSYWFMWPAIALFMTSFFVEGNSSEPATGIRSS